MIKDTKSKLISILKFLWFKHYRFQYKAFLAGIWRHRHTFVGSFKVNPKLSLPPKTEELLCLKELISVLKFKILTCSTVGWVMWWPFTKVNASGWSGVTVHTPSHNEIKQCRAWIDGPNICKAFVFADPTCFSI